MPCPLRSSYLRTIRLGQDLARALRRLRRDYLRCLRCPCAGSCELLQAFQSQLEAAIWEVNQEWEQNR